MSNPIINWWRSRQFSQCLKKGNLEQAQQLLQEIQRSGARLSQLQKIFRDKLQSEQRLNQYTRELTVLRGQITQVSKNSEELRRQLEQKEQEFVSVQHQLAGRSQEIENLRNQLNQSPRSLLDKFLLEQHQNFIKIYFLVYFLEGVYSAYLAWFLVYQSGFLQTKASILDIGAGSGAMLYGLYFFLRSAEEWEPLPQSHISYCSLERQNFLQHHGLEFWKQYIENQPTEAVNTYFRFKTIDLFTYDRNSRDGGQLPKNFFEYIVISHCIFAEQEQREKSHQVYRQIFKESLKDNGYVLVVVQGRRLFQAYSCRLTENQTEEHLNLQSNTQKFPERWLMRSHLFNRSRLCHRLSPS